MSKQAKQIAAVDGIEVYDHDRSLSGKDRKHMDRKITKRIPLEQASPSDVCMSIYSKALKQVPADFFMTTGSAYTDVIPMRAFKVLKDVTLEISVEIKTTAARLAPVNQWFNRIELKQDSEVLTSIYPDYFQAALSLMDRHKLEVVQQGLGINKSLGLQKSLASGTRKNFYLPLIGRMFNRPLIWSNLKSDLTFDFYSAGNPVADGAGTVSVTGMRFIIDTEQLHDGHQQVYHKVLSQEVKAHSFIEGVTQNFPAIALTQSVPSELVLSSLTSRQTAALLLAIRPQNSSNTSNGRQNYRALGPRGTIDLKTAGGDSLFAGGNAITEEYLRTHIIGAHLDNDWFINKRLYILPFCRDIKAAVYGGIRDGYMDLSSATDKLVITPDVLETKEVHALSISAALTAGNYRIGFRGEWTPVLVYTSTAAQIKTAIEAMDVFKYAPSGPITVTCSATLEATAVNFTFDNFANSYPDNKEPVEFWTQEAKLWGTSITTSGLPGFVAGTFDISVTALKYKELTLFDGVFKTSDYS